jgi:hypothetical protein
MVNLSIKTQNKKGNEPQSKENLGLVVTFLRHSDDFIVIDDFEGAGDNYKQKELTEIRVYENGEILFQGDKYEFFNQLRK